jgi:hypothetical protein
MMRLASDENFNQDIVRGLLRRLPNLSIVSVQETGPLGAADPTVLAWAAAEGRILLTHDRKTMPNFAYERVGAGLETPGVYVVSDRIPVDQAIDELYLLATCSRDGEWDGQVVYVPL